MLVPDDVTALVVVTRGALGYNKRTQQYFQTVTIHNTSGMALAGPISLVLDNPSPRCHDLAVKDGPGEVYGTTENKVKQGKTNVLLDLDPWGPGLGRLLGFDDVEGIRWDAVASAGGRLASRSLRAALPERDGLALLTYGAGPPPPLDGASVREVVAAAQRGGDRVVVDLPRTAIGAVADDEPGAAAFAQCDRVVLVVAGTVSGVASAARVADRLGTDRTSVGLVVRSVATAVGPDEAADALGLPLVADYPSRRRVVEQVDLGLGPVHGRRSPLARAAADVLAWAGAVP